MLSLSRLTITAVLSLGIITPTTALDLPSGHTGQGSQSVDTAALPSDARASTLSSVGSGAVDAGHIVHVAQLAPAAPPPRVPALSSPSPVGSAASAASEERIIDGANAYLNGLTTLVAKFIQSGGDERTVTGTLYLQRPGKLRFEYDPPATLEVISDGSSVAIRDRKLATQDLYLLSQTPLKFLLREGIELGRDLRVVRTAQHREGVSVSLEDSSTLGGTSQITLFFDRAIVRITKWHIVDPQGLETTVSLSNVDPGRSVDPRLFVINYERMLPTP